MYGGNGHFQYSKGKNSKSRKTRVLVYVFCMVLTFVSSFMKICQAVLKLWTGHKNCQHAKDNNSKIRKTRNMVLVFCTLSHGV